MSIRTYIDDQGRERYIIDYYPYPGKRVQRLVPEVFQGSREEAQLYHDYLIEKRDKKTSLPTGKTIGDLAAAFYQYARMHKAATTAVDMEGIFKNHVLPHMRDIEISEIRPGDFEVYKLARQKEKGGARTINKEIAYIRSFFKWAASQKLCAPLDFRVETLPYKPPKPHVLRMEDIVNICKAADLLHRCIFLCLYQAGMRRNEALGLKWEDVYWEQGVIRILGKGDKERLVPMGEWLQKSLRELFEKAGTEKGYKYFQREGHIFLCIKTKKPLKDFRKALQGAAAKAGIKQDVNPHLLRHSVATQMIANGTDIRKVQVFLGHEDISMTQRYTHIAVEFLREHIVEVTNES